MKDNKNAQQKFNQLRRQAEELVRVKNSFSPAVDMDDPMKLIHELQTYHMELELQNDELKRSQQELMKAQDKYRQLYDFLPVGYVSLNLKGMILDVNLTLADMLSIERVHLTNNPLSAYIVFEDQDIYYRHLQELSKSTQGHICELRMKTEQGRVFHVQLESSVILDKNENHMQYRTVVIDICERKVAEEKLQQFKSIVSCSNDLMALIDANFVCLTANPSLLGAFKKTSDEIIGHSISEFFDDDFFKKTIKPKAKKCMAGHELRFSSWFEFPATGQRHLDVEYSPFYGEDKKIKGFVVNARDNTDLKKAQTLIETAKLQLETVLNNIDLSVYITDMKTNRILFMNKHLKRYYKEDLTGKLCWQSLHINQDGPCKFCTNGKLINTDGSPKEPFVSELYNQKKDKWYAKSDSAIPWIDGNLVHIAITTDITGQKKRQEKQMRIKTILEDKVRKRTAELEDMNAALKVLLKKRDEDQDEMEDKIFANHKLILSPIIANLKKNLSRESNLKIIELLELELKNIMSPFSKKLSDQMINLTPTEIHVADLIKIGKSSKEISSMLDSSIHTIARHRENIRKKMGIKNKKTNLRSYLLTFQ